MTNLVRRASYGIARFDVDSSARAERTFCSAPWALRQLRGGAHREESSARPREVAMCARNECEKNAIMRLESGDETITSSGHDERGSVKRATGRAASAIWTCQTTQSDPLRLCGRGAIYIRRDGGRRFGIACVQGGGASRRSGAREALPSLLRRESRTAEQAWPTGPLRPEANESGGKVDEWDVIHSYCVSSCETRGWMILWAWRRRGGAISFCCAGGDCVVRLPVLIGSVHTTGPHKRDTSYCVRVGVRRG